MRTRHPGLTATPLAAATLALLLVTLPPAPARGEEPTGSSRLDPRLRSLITHVEEARAGRLAPQAFLPASARLFPSLGLRAEDERLTVDCLVLTGAGGRESLESMGLAVRSWLGPVATVSIPVDDLQLLEEAPGIRRVEMGGAMKPLLDVSRTVTRAIDAQGAGAPPYPPTGFTGRNVVVGVVDTGIDFNHDDFRNGASSTRVEFLWDQTVDGSAPGGFGYGTEWTAAQINAGSSTQVDNDGHGSHVAGIAAGDGSATNGSESAFQYVGMAPEAPIIAVKTGFNEVQVADAVSYIMNKAGTRDCVVNLSLGTQFGPHDGTSNLDVAIGSLVGPGRMVVVAAGNEGNAGLHARLTPGPAIGDSVVCTFTVPTYSPSGSLEYVVLDGWYDTPDNCSFRIESPLGRRTRELTLGQTLTTCLPPNPGGVANGDGRVYMENGFAAASNGDREVYIEITDGSAGVACGNPRAGTWKIIAYRKNSAGGPGTINFWIANAFLNGTSDYPAFTGACLSEEMLIGSPASAPNVISVGAFVTKRFWTSEAGPRQYVGLTDGDIGRIAFFSSPGPLRDGRFAPLISAPGMGIGSVRSASRPSNGGSTSFFLTDGRHVIDQGTSQASPHVAGAVALLYERFPHETPANIVNRIINSAVRDAFTGAAPNTTYGHGKLDVVGLLNAGVPVALASFAASPLADGIRLEWVAESDAPYAGFHVTRAGERSGEYLRLTDRPLTGGPRFRFDDRTASPDREWWYRLEAVEQDGSITRFGPYAARAGSPPLALAPNGPNPFRGSTVIGFSLPAPERVSLRVFDLGGRLVRTLHEGMREAGTAEFTWDGRDDAGRAVPAGVYFYALDTGSGRLSRKMVLER